MEPEKITDLRGITVFSCVGVGILAGFVLSLIGDIQLSWPAGKEGHLRMSYADYAAILLTSIAVLVTVLGVIIAIFAFVGYSTINKTVRELSNKTAKAVVSNALEKGGVLNDLVDESLKPGGSLYTSVQESVFKIMYREIGLEESSAGDDDSDTNNAKDE